MNAEIFTADAQCESCHGTGLYVGMAERDGAAVVCHTCKGTGCHKIVVKYQPFEQRQPAPKKVLRVLQTNPGIIVGEDANHKLDWYGGVPLVTWLADASAPAKPGAEMRNRVCPAWWYQSADYQKKPEWNDADRKCGYGSFSDCRHFGEKAGCWSRWDRENAK